LPVDDKEQRETHCSESQGDSSIHVFAEQPLLEPIRADRDCQAKHKDSPEVGQG
jgi:hypothetical protein